MKFNYTASRLRGMKHIGGITRVLVKHGFGELAGRLFGRRELNAGDLKRTYPSPRRIRHVLEELGPSFIKLGQLMSTRADVFPPEYIEEFSKLQDRVPPVAFDAVRTVIERELGSPLDEIFEHFDRESIAAASVAQVHVARLKSGETVAVKVIRPAIDKRIAADIQLMYYLAEKIDRHFEIGRVIGTVNLVKEFERTIFRELDMLVEAGHIERFRENFKGSEEIYIPEVHWDYTSKSVLVMEHIKGVKMDRVEAIRAMGIDPKEVAMIGLRSFSRQLMEVGLFHADPHPGNTLVMADGRVSLVDFGIVGYLDEETMLQIANIFLGYAEHDYDMILDAFESAGLISGETMDLRSFRLDLKDMSEPFYGRSLQTISVTEVYSQIMQLVYKYQIQLPRNLLLLLKTFIQTEALGKILGSDASLLEVTRPYARRLLQRGYEAQKILKNVGRNLKDTGNYLRWVPKMTHEFLRRAAKGQHRLELKHDGLKEASRRFEAGLNRLTIGFIISASIIAASLILNSSQKVMNVRIEMLGIEALDITKLLGLSGYCIATILGLWLIVSIFRSGKM